MTDVLLTEQHLKFLSLTGGCTGSSASIHVKMPHCWKSHVAAHLSNEAVHEIVALVPYASRDSSKEPVHMGSITTANAAHTRKVGMQMMLDLVVFMHIAGTS